MRMGANPSYLPGYYPLIRHPHSDKLGRTFSPCAAGAFHCINGKQLLTWEAKSTCMHLDRTLQRNYQNVRFEYIAVIFAPQTEKLCI